jgi:hypothetical protein
MGDRYLFASGLSSEESQRSIKTLVSMKSPVETSFLFRTFYLERYLLLEWRKAWLQR